MAEARLVRFVAGPDGEVTPDVYRKLPGRGMWVAADRLAVDLAAKKNLFSRAAKAKLTAPLDLADRVAALLHRRLLSSLGLARKSGELTSGFERVLSAVSSGKAAFLIEASDGASDGRRKLLSAARRSARPPRLVGLFASDELGLALGGETVIHTAFLAGRSADSWTEDVERISGFRPLFPERWREEP
jgi:predicted RNA-binding protein YlxR (DUF448 family)